MNKSVLKNFYNHKSVKILKSTSDSFFKVFWKVIQLYVHLEESDVGTDFCVSGIINTPNEIN